MILGGTGSVKGGTGGYLLVLGPEQRGTRYQCFQKMYDLNYQIMEYLKKEKVFTDKQMDTQTDRHNFLL